MIERSFGARKPTSCAASSAPIPTAAPACFCVLSLALLANASVEAQGLQDLSFGQADTFEVITWNIEWFPKNGQQTVNLVQEAIVALDVDVLALQEVEPA